MHYNKLGTTDIDVSAIVMGCWGIGGGYTWGEQDENESIKTITTAVDLGINLFDKAEFYSDGYSEEVVGNGNTKNANGSQCRSMANGLADSVARPGSKSHSLQPGQPYWKPGNLSEIQ